MRQVTLKTAGEIEAGDVISSVGPGIRRTKITSVSLPSVSSQIKIMFGKFFKWCEPNEEFVFHGNVKEASNA